MLKKRPENADGHCHGIIRPFLNERMKTAELNPISLADTFDSIANLSEITMRIYVMENKILLWKTDKMIFQEFILTS